MPFMPFFRNRSTIKSPKIDGKGLMDGTSASSPASIPAQGINETRITIAKTAPAPFPKSARSAFLYPPYFLPRCKKRSVAAKKIASERITGRKKYSV